MDEKSTHRVGEVLPRVVELMGLEDKFEAAKLMRAWSDVVGAVVAKKSRPRMIKDGILYIEAENSVWMQELWYRQNQIVERIAKQFPKAKVTGIRVGIERENS